MIDLNFVRIVINFEIILFKILKLLLITNFAYFNKY